MRLARPHAPLKLETIATPRPRPGQIRVAHQPDEYVEIDQLARCSRFLATLTERLARGELPLRG